MGLLEKFTFRIHEMTMSYYALDSHFSLLVVDRREVRLARPYNYTGIHLENTFTITYMAVLEFY